MISKRPNKIWLYNLSDDPVEEYNLANLIDINAIENISNINSIRDRFIDGRYNQTFKIIYNLYRKLNNLDVELSKPLWPSLIEVPILVDKTSQEVQSEDDEVIYWAN